MQQDVDIVAEGRVPGGAASGGAAAPRRELYFFALYRLLEAALLVGLCFSPLGERLIVLVSEESAQIASIAYLVGAVALFAAAIRFRAALVTQVLVGIVLDVAVAGTAFFAIDGLEAGIAALLLVNVSSVALLLPARDAYPVALLASIVVVAGLGLGGGGLWTEATLFAATYIGATLLMQSLRTRMVEAERRVERQEADLADLARVNAMILKRMSTGVLVVDRANRIRRMNDAAQRLLGRIPAGVDQLLAIAPDLAQRLDEWRVTGSDDPLAMQLASDAPPVVPRFARFGVGGDDLALVLLDDVSVVTRQAEQLTLTSLGRLSASIAHEIRNPLAAIRYAAELLGESDALVDEERRLVEIIRGQCGRMNGIVDNILLLARRERSRPERIDLVAWVREWVTEYTGTNQLAGDQVEAVLDRDSLTAMVDPGQLRQVLWNLVHNARRYGRDASGKAQVSLYVREVEGHHPAIEVIDTGPGIPPDRALLIFEPFQTSSDHSTGLGLYIARQLCEANLGRLDYVKRPGGGACFRITLAAPGG
jgi:two-component system sensor histidine kinase PilS (NtrC family)